MTDDHFGSAYRGTRQRVTELITSLSTEELERMVPACPEWSLKDLFGHLTAIATDVVGGRWDGHGSLEWSGNPEPYLDLFSMYGMPEKELDE